MTEKELEIDEDSYNKIYENGYGEGYCDAITELLKSLSKLGYGKRINIEVDNSRLHEGFVSKDGRVIDCCCSIYDILARIIKAKENND